MEDFDRTAARGPTRNSAGDPAHGAGRVQLFTITRKLHAICAAVSVIFPGWAAFSAVIAFDWRAAMRPERPSHAREETLHQRRDTANTRRRDMASSQSRRINRRVVKIRQTKRLGLRIPLFLMFASLIIAIPAILINLSLEKWTNEYRAWQHRRVEGKSLHDPAPKLKWDWGSSGE